MSTPEDISFSLEELRRFHEERGVEDDSGEFRAWLEVSRERDNFVAFFQKAANKRAKRVKKRK